jgi:hypothetical protein
MIFISQNPLFTMMVEDAARNPRFLLIENYVLMKQSLLLIIFAFLTSCSGTKYVAEKHPKAVAETVTIKDSVIVINNDPLIEKPVASITKEIDIEGTSKELETPVSFEHNLWQNLLQKYVSNKGNVNYKGFKAESAILRKYIATLSDNTPTDSWSKNETLAYWINAYNAMTIDLILRHYPIKSIKDIDKPWDQRFWKLGETWYNLNDIEHEILRKMNEPRIHFSIVCASFSCPKLSNKAYTAAQLETQLTKATKDFLSDFARNEITADNIKLSKIFQWFSKDFKRNGSLIDFLNVYSEIKISDHAKKSFKEYNWDLNE